MQTGQSKSPVTSANTAKKLASGTAVKIINPGPVPHWCEADDDRGRTSGPVKKRVQEMFFRGDRKIKAEIAWITSESERDELGRKGWIKVKVRESSGTTLTFTAALNNIQKA